MQPFNRLKKKSLAVFIIVLLGSILISAFAYHIASSEQRSSTATASQTARATAPATIIPTATPTINPVPTPTETPTPIPTIAPITDPGTVLGIDSDASRTFANILWVRLGYPTCGFGNLTGSVLKNTIQKFHNQGYRVLVITCQSQDLYNTQPLNDIAQSGADAVQCGNEQMKIDRLTSYVPPANFAKYFDLCQHAVHAVQPNATVILGALDPHVGGIDIQPLWDQVNYLNQMQYAMNTWLHPGGHWSWRSQIVGLIDSWHNGYPNQYTNSLYGLFVFWAQQFGVDLNSGGLGKHLWVVEGTGCFKGCGIDPYSPYQVAVSHVLTLITDAQTSTRYRVPFFYFSDKDFVQSGVLWPIGILDLDGHPKPIRQDLPMGARTLVMSCSNGQVRVSDQEQLLAKLYAGCSLPGDYINTLTG